MKIIVPEHKLKLAKDPWNRDTYVPNIKGKKYYANNNGSLPYLININSGVIYVFTSNYDGDIPYFDKAILRIDKYDKVFIGKDWTHKQFNGNSILIKLNNNEYIFVGEYLYKFKTKDVIKKYYSPIGNSAVSYPYAIGDKFTYLMNEGVYFDNDYIEDNVDPYEFYYGKSKEFKKGKLIAKKFIRNLLDKKTRLRKSVI